MIDLSGKVALITGAAGGIGAATAQQFATCGASVVITDILQAQGRATERMIRQQGGEVMFLHHDVANEDEWETVVSTTIREFGGLDILMNNAAVEQILYLTEVSHADIQRLLSINVGGTILGLKHAIREMRPGGAAGKGGSIINVSSIAGLVGFAGLGIYSATKGGVRLLSKSAAIECGRLNYGIRVNSIHPGYVETAMGGKLLEELVKLGIFPDMETAREQNLAAFPIGRTGVPNDIAQAALFLASDLSSWITGTELVVDGGTTAW